MAGQVCCLWLGAEYYYHLPSCQAALRHSAWQQQVQLAAHRLQQLPPHRRGTGLEGLACLPPLEPVRFLLLRAPLVMRITSKGQVTIPQEIREQCCLLPHTQVRFVDSNVSLM